MSISQNVKTLLAQKKLTQKDLWQHRTKPLNPSKKNGKIRV